MARITRLLSWKQTRADIPENHLPLSHKLSFDVICKMFRYPSWFFSDLVISWCLSLFFSFGRPAKVYDVLQGLPVQSLGFWARKSKARKPRSHEFASLIHCIASTNFQVYSLVTVNVYDHGYFEPINTTSVQNGIKRICGSNSEKLVTDIWVVGDPNINKYRNGCIRIDIDPLI